MKKMNNKSGFTLLEIIIVIIIIGVLASLALPRMFAMTANAKAVEALNAFKVIRNGMDMCFMMNNGSYAGTGPANACNDWARIGVNNPGTEPGSHFTYTVPQGLGVATYNVVATLTGAVPASTLTYTMNRAGAAGAVVVITGTGSFASIRITDQT